MVEEGGVKNVGRVFTFTALVPAKGGKAEAASDARESVAKVLHKTGVAIAGFRVASTDTPCPTCGRTQRELVGLEEGELTVTVSVRADEEPDLAAAFKGSKIRSLGDVREGAA
jgi:hypothetical protein